MIHNFIQIRIVKALHPIDKKNFSEKIIFRKKAQSAIFYYNNEIAFCNELKFNIIVL